MSVVGTEPQRRLHVGGRGRKRLLLALLAQTDNQPTDSRHKEANLSRCDRRAFYAKLKSWFVPCVANQI